MLSAPVTIALDVVAWGVFHAATGYFAHRLDDRQLSRDNWLLRPRAYETSRWYRRWLRIERWKDRVPEAGALFPGGISKAHLPAPGRSGLDLFIRETRRAELAHWWAMACGPLFALWNDPLPTTLLIAYGVLVNLPFIAIQRYNRIRARTVLDRHPRAGGS
jgi:glycosyl-4,4'-diaponeurosporenoate acyltransferase